MAQHIAQAFAACDGANAAIYGANYKSFEAAVDAKLQEWGKAMLPFYIYYSMFGFQRIGDFIWAGGDMQAKGFLLGATVRLVPRPDEFLTLLLPVKAWRDLLGSPTLNGTLTLGQGLSGSAAVLAASW